MKLASLKLASLALLLGGADQTRAASILYTNKADFLAATSGLTTINFNGIAPKNNFIAYGPGPLTLSGVTFTSNGFLYVIDPGYYSFPYTNGGFLTSDFINPDKVMAVGLPAGTTAVGFDFGALFAGGGVTTFTIDLSTGEHFTASTTGSPQTNNLGFVGFTSDTPIASLTITMPDADFFNAIDNFAFGAGVPAPEPATITLLGVGIAGMAVYGRRRMKHRCPV
jgi:hypothetical protein